MSAKFNTHISSKEDRGKAGEMSRLFNAAIVDRKFCDLLLNRPDRALTDGYNGEPFALSKQDRKLILEAKSTSLVDLAKHCVQYSSI